ncbi:NAD-dependent epimerase/dehydratase family protein [Arthrobacter antibioticus]|uniref:NAD-dependent epimerase/dehydratase family protein n=1 Tax=Arthrobacter sp. H35-MC1 TaxID=3046203 RepID=UPI0024B9E608|nr:NAD-dependent epimerase/dehydratase family protein [Arthrobacter sp. H35-MC1]MDJ0316389.1 NAD-dependent epimerase/dehydratase family protein [Arthrobacter sp. H35-MC1]
MSGDSSALRWLVVGSSGFVGTAIVAQLRERGLVVDTLSAPRLSSEATTAQALIDEAHAICDSASASAFRLLCSAFANVDVVVNAAGLATPGDSESPSLTGANALLPPVIALAAKTAGVRRFVHVSSASVQGHRKFIDETTSRAPFSAYSRSKALGEEALEELARDSAIVDGASGPGKTSWVSVRATSVQGPSRPTTLSLVKVASSPLSSVAAPGTAPTPVSSINALAWFVVEAGQYPGTVPPLVLQPWEGLSVTDVLAAAGGRSPLRLPPWLCHTVLRCGYLASGLIKERLHGPIRRVELMWFGQVQAPGWAETVGLSAEQSVRTVLEQARTPRPSA